jgi:lantibiotic modifying enzyme
MHAALLLPSSRGARGGYPQLISAQNIGSGQTLGNIEFLCEAADVIGGSELRKLASERLMLVLETARANRDYRWNIGHSRYNLGLFRGLAGVGYTCLRRVDADLPNVLLWE